MKCSTTVHFPFLTQYNDLESKSLLVSAGLLPKTKAASHTHYEIHKSNFLIYIHSSWAVQWNFRCTSFISPNTASSLCSIPWKLFSQGKSVLMLSLLSSDQNQWNVSPSTKMAVDATKQTSDIFLQSEDSLFQPLTDFVTVWHLHRDRG